MEEIKTVLEFDHVPECAYCTDDALYGNRIEWTCEKHLPDKRKFGWFILERAESGVCNDAFNFIFGGTAVGTLMILANHQGFIYNATDLLWLWGVGIGLFAMWAGVKFGAKYLKKRLVHGKTWPWVK